MLSSFQPPIACRRYFPRRHAEEIRPIFCRWFIDVICFQQHYYLISLEMKYAAPPTISLADVLHYSPLPSRKAAIRLQHIFYYLVSENLLIGRRAFSACSRWLRCHFLHDMISHCSIFDEPPDYIEYWFYTPFSFSRQPKIDAAAAIRRVSPKYI